MSKQNNSEESLRLIARGRKQFESDQIKKLRDEESFNLENVNRYWSVSQNKRLPLPTVSPVEVASIAATLLSPQRDAKAACQTALMLIRESAALIEEERMNDERTQGYLEDNKANQRMWQNIGSRIEKIYQEKGSGKPFREGLFKDRFTDDSLYPFPISRVELYALAGVNDDAGRKRLDGYLKRLYKSEDLTPEQASVGYKAHKKSHDENGIYQPEFLQFAKTWPELRKVMKECAKKK